MIHFASNAWLWTIALLLPLTSILFFRTHLARRRLFRTFSNARGIFAPDASFSLFKQRSKEIMVLCGLLLLLLALARPQWGAEWRETRSRGVDVIFALDISRSMLAADIVPNRLERSVLAIRDALPALSGNRLGLVPFSGSAFLQTPLTQDFSAFVQALNLMQPGLLARGGTNIAAAIEEARAAFGEGENFKVLILISDGENLADDALLAAEKAAEANIRVFTIGVGSPQGSQIPIQDPRGRPDFLRDEQGNIVVTRLDETTLQRIARAADGFYTELGSTGEGLQRVVASGVGSIPPQELESRLEQIPIERFQIFVVFAVLALGIEFVLGNRRFRRNLSRGSALPSLITAVAALFFATPGEAQTEQDALLQFHEGEFASAAEAFGALISEQGVQPRLVYNQGVAAYRAADFEQAIRHLNRALATTDLDLQADTFHNLANAHFRLGEQQIQSDPGAAREHWEAALNGYENTLELKPGEPNAGYNRDVVEQLLRQLDEQMEQSPEDEGNPDSDQNESDEGENQSGDQSPSEGNGSGENQDEPDANAREPDREGEDTPERGESEESEENASPPGETDSMSILEAEQLLDALRQRERLLPLMQSEETGTTDRSTPQRDW